MTTCFHYILCIIWFWADMDINCNLIGVWRYTTLRQQLRCYFSWHSRHSWYKHAIQCMRWDKRGWPEDRVDGFCIYNYCNQIFNLVTRINVCIKQQIATDISELYASISPFISQFYVVSVLHLRSGMTEHKKHLLHENHGLV